MKHISNFEKFSLNENFLKKTFDWIKGKKTTEVPAAFYDVFKRNMNSDGTLKSAIQIDIEKQTPQDIKNFYDILRDNGVRCRISSAYYDNMQADTYGNPTSDYGSSDPYFYINRYDFNRQIEEGKIKLEEKDGKLYLIHK